MSQFWWVYIIETETGKLYTGISTDVDRRFAEHQNPAKKGAKFFRVDAPKLVVYRERCNNRSEASKRECIIKRFSRKQKLELLTASLTNA